MARIRRAQGCLNERMLACAWISWLPCFVFTNSLNGSLSLNYEREEGGTRSSQHDDATRRFSRDKRAWRREIFKRRGPAIASMETMRRTGRLISRADFLDDINCAASREEERETERNSPLRLKRLPKRVGRVARETNWRSYRTESVESAAAAKFVLPDITPIRQIYSPSCPPYRTWS